MIKKLIEKIKTQLESSIWIPLAVSFGAFILIVILSFTRSYELFELTLYDIRFKIKPPASQWQNLSFLNIDDHSINSAGQFPWPRSIYAGGMDVLNEVGVRQVVYDVQFMDPSPKTINPVDYVSISERIRQNKTLSSDELKRAIVDSDAVFAASLKRTKGSVLAYSFSKSLLPDWHLDEKTRKERADARVLFMNRASIPVPDGRSAEFSDMIDPDRVQIQSPIPPFVRSAADFGFVDSDFDIDGASRKIRLVRVFEDRIYFNLALAMVMELCQVKKEKIEINPGRNIVLKEAVNPVSFVKEDIVIPINDKGMLYINWVDDFNESFNHISYFALIEYPIVRDEIHSFLDEEETKSGSTERTELYGKLLQISRALAASDDISEKGKLNNEKAVINKRILEIEKGYSKSLLDEKNALQKKFDELKKDTGKEDREIKKGINDIQTYLTAINIVLSVEALRGHSAIVGLTATATQDIGVTPLSSEYMMVGSYHNIANTILQKQFIKKAPFYVSLIIMFALSLLMGFILQRLSAKHSLITLAGSFVFANIIVISLFALAHIWIDQLGISLSMVLPAIVIISVKFVSEESQKRFIKSAFSYYLSPGVIDQIVKNPDSLQLGGELRNISIFFSDVAGFSTISEKLTPQQLVSLLNEYLSEMTDIILSYNGTVDKYEGDAIIAFYGAPLLFDDHALKMCLAAVDMKRRLAELRESWRSRGQDPLVVRMGMNTGDAVVGNMGSRTRMDYTMMGDAVNLTARLEGANKFYDTHAMISHTTYDIVKDKIEARKLDMIRVIGKIEPITVYELLGRTGGLSDNMYEMLARYNEGMEFFTNRDWQSARNSFRGALKIIDDDGPSRVYVDRCTEYMKKPPSKTWDGVYKLKSK